MTTTSPQKLGRYEVLEEIGKGAMGVVYLARDPLIGRQVALKTFRVGFSAKDQELLQFRSRFVREAQSAGILSHPNIVTIHDVVDEGSDGVCFIAMEFVKGTNLKQLLQRPDAISREFVVEIVSQIAEALDYAHSRGVVHRDIKPANILITQENKVKITDFGIARLDTSNLTMEGQLLGTPNYMAPEQIQGKEVDHRADIFSLGVVFYEMLTRRKPFQGENLTAVTHKIVYEPFTPPEELVADLPASLAAVLRRCLEKDSNRRFPRAAEIAAELRQAAVPTDEDEAGDDTSATQEVAEEIVEKTTPPAPATFVEPARKAPAARADAGAAPAAPAASAAIPASAATTPTSPAAAPVAPLSGSMQVSAALQRLRNQRLVQYGLTALAGLAIATLGVLWLSGRTEPAPTIAVAAAGAEQALREEVAARVAEAQRAMDQGNLQAALQIVAGVEQKDPGNADARALRQEVDRVSRDLAIAAGREQRVSEGLILAREEFSKRHYEQAIVAAQDVLAAVPEHFEATKLLTDSEAGLARQKDRQRTAKPATTATSLPPASGSSAPVVTPSLRSSTSSAVLVEDATLAIDFASDSSEGVLTIYSGERQIVREPFKFVRKTGFLRSEKISGSMNLDRTLPAGPIALRVYVSLPGKPTRSIVVEGVLAGGASRRLEVRVDGEGHATATLL